MNEINRSLYELRNHIEKNGKRGLLPQNLTNFLLGQMGLEADAAKSNQNKDMPFSALFTAILYLQNGPKMFEEEEVGIEPELFMEHFDLYTIAIGLEELRRNKIINIPSDSLPTLENIFDPKRSMDVSVSEKYQKRGPLDPRH